MKLYYYPLSGHCHRVMLFLSLLGIEHEEVFLDLAKREHKADEILKLNPFGQVPILVDGDAVIPDSNAILVYLANKNKRSDWLPETPVEAAAVQRWLSVAAGELAIGPARARLITVFGAPYDAADTIQRAHVTLKLVEAELTARPYLTGAKPTIADIALYSYISSAPEGNVDLSGYANVLAWLGRIEALPGFLPFKKTAVGLAA